MSARIVTWNLERKRPDGPLGAGAVDYLFGLRPDVMVLTEARTTFPLRNGHSLWCEPPLGARFAADERKVLIWSNEPWRDIDRCGVDGLDRSRFISASTDTPIGPLRVVGVCVPWHMAEVTYPAGEKRRPWELHVRYLEVLRYLIEGLDGPTVVAGDFNQQVPRIKYGNRAAAAALEVAFSGVEVATRGVLSGTVRPGIDHVAFTPDLEAVRAWGWPNAVNGRRLSDHDGAGVDVQPTAR